MASAASLLMTATQMINTAMKVVQVANTLKQDGTAEAFAELMEALDAICNMPMPASPVPVPVTPVTPVTPVDGWPVYEADVAVEVPVAVEAALPLPKTWSVHDCHTYHKKGEWVATAIADGQYGIGVAPTFGSKDSSNEKIMGPLGEVIVSKLRWKHAKDISVGDTLFMGATHAKKVYKGLVTAQPVAGPFCPLSSSDNSFRIKFGAGPSGCYDNEVELTFNVSWEEVGPLTDEWKNYLGTKRRTTVSALTAAPPA